MRIHALLAFASVLAACPDELEVAAVCATGEQNVCACEDGALGTQTCAADGTSFDACVCACVPASCDELGVACGEADSGCGPIECGDCAENATCGDGACTCDDGFSELAGSCVDVDECADALDDCDANATCADAIGSFTCACLPGFLGDGRTCDVDECAQGLDDCDANATCADDGPSFTCTCLEGFTGDGSVCVGDEDALVADRSADPLLVSFLVDDALGEPIAVTALVEGVSRIGWDIPFVSVQAGPNLEKIPSAPPVIAPVTMRALRTSPLETALFADALEAHLLDGTPVTVVVALDAEGASMTLDVTMTATVTSVDASIAGDAVAEVVFQPSTFTLSNVVRPIPSTTPPRFAPGLLIEIEGVGAWDAQQGDADIVGSEDPIALRDVRDPAAVFVFAKDAFDLAAASGDVTTLERRAMSVAQRDEGGAEIARRNGFELWISRMTLLNPAKTGDRPPFDVVARPTVVAHSF